MKLIFKKSDLAGAVNIVLKAVPSKTTMTILECILIDATTNEIKFTANDMELGIETIVNGEILDKGQIAIEAKIFSDIVRKLPDSEIVIETDNNYQMVIILLLSLSAMEKMVCLMVSFKVNWDKKINLSFSINGR